jgi:hypothetical protein
MVVKKVAPSDFKKSMLGESDNVAPGDGDLSPPSFNTASRLPIFHINLGAWIKP